MNTDPANSLLKEGLTFPAGLDVTGAEGGNLLSLSL